MNYSGCQQCQQCTVPCDNCLNNIWRPSTATADGGGQEVEEFVENAAVGIVGFAQELSVVHDSASNARPWTPRDLEVADLVRKRRAQGTSATVTIHPPKPGDPYYHKWAESRPLPLREVPHSEDQEKQP